ncbi:hypothetical protein FJZ33_10155 [Candidatus Poribacteria bacterium]|nr:hypothetical protein [Candidatus Poribacteria bacterium]
MKGNIGEYIAARILGIELEKSGSNAGFDGKFKHAPLTSQTVNIKYLKDDRNIDLNKKNKDYYLVMTSPERKLPVSGVTLLPICIKEVFLFKAEELSTALKSENPNKKLGMVTSIPHGLWNKAQLYPIQTCNLLILTNMQREMFALFDPARVADIL